MNEPEWSPWVDWHGGPCPCVGEYVQTGFKFGIPDSVANGKIVDRFTGEWIAKDGPSWRHDATFNPIIRYRIRKPRGMVILERILADLPVDGHLETV